MQPIAELQASVVGSTRLRFPLFRTVEGCIRTLRLFLLADASCRQHTQPWKASPAAFIQQVLCPTSSPSPPSPDSLLSLDLLCSLLCAAVHSTRSTTLVNPFPACFLKGSADGSEAKLSDDLQDTDDQLDVRVDQKFITQQLPSLEAAFSHLPALAAIDFSSSSSSSPASSTTSLASCIPLASLPSDVLALLSCLLSSHVRLSCVPVQANLYTLGTSEAHLHAAATSTLPSSSLTLPSYQFNLSHLPDPLFRSLSSTHSTFLAFHGSPFANWHSILRRGLESKSGTKEQTSGAIFGSGIYLSDDLRVARMFSGVGEGWERSAMGEGLEVVGLYEVVNDPAGVRTKEEERERGGEAVPENYIVVSSNSFLRLKSLLVWKAPRASRQERRGMWMIAAYALVLLAIILSRVDWKYTSNTAHRLMHQKRI